MSEIRDMVKNYGGPKYTAAAGLGGADTQTKEFTVGGPTGFGKEAVGNLKSDAIGSGARFNAGKSPVELIPVWIIADWARQGYEKKTPLKLEAINILTALGEWQKDTFHASTILGMFDGDWIKDCAAVFDYGKRKYAEWNWAKGMKWSIPVACITRHALAILNGEENDPESGLPHRGHIACNVVMLAQYEQTYRAGDDRPLKWLNPGKLIETDDAVAIAEVAQALSDPLVRHPPALTGIDAISGNMSYYHEKVAHPTNDLDRVSTDAPSENNNLYPNP